MDYKVTFGFFECLAVVGFSSLVAMSYGLGEFLVKKVIERKRKHTGGSLSELYDDNKLD